MTPITPSAFKAVQEACAKVCDKRAERRWEEHGYTEPDTNASYYLGEWEGLGDSLDEEDADCAAAIRSLTPSSIPGLTVAGESDVRDLDTPAVRFYERDFYPLSNFSAFTVWWRGCCFQTSEHAYHWAKFPQPDHQVAIIHSISAHEAFKYAERHRQDRHADWDAIKVNVMRDILHAKAGQHEYVRRKLLETGDRLLIEDSWRDDFWGWGPNRDGQNMLGKLWMEIRAGMTHALTTAPGKEENSER